MTFPIESSDAVKKNISIKVIGVGGAGGNAVIHMAQQGQGLDGVTFALAHTNLSKAGEMSGEKILLGQKLTRGLGCGGDPEMGRAATLESVEKIKQLCANTDIVFIIAGMGGGTGTGAAPIFAQIAKETGALVIGIVALPFQFEGLRRQRQAQIGLQQLKSAADAVICLPNQKIFKLIDENTTALDAFKISNNLLAEGVRGVRRLFGESGLVNVDFADLCAVTRGRHSESSFATAEAGGENVVQQIVDKLLSHPLLEDGSILAESDSVLVSLTGGPDLTMIQIDRLMEQINRYCENADIIFGAAINPQFSNRMAVTLIASKRNNREEVKTQQNFIAQAKETFNDTVETKSEKTEETDSIPRPASRFASPAPVLPEDRKEKLFNQQQRSGVNKRKKNAGQQGMLPLEIVSRGRFEKSEPTIRGGKNLDVPTYVRCGIALN